LDLAILRMLTQNPLTAYEMNTNLVKKFSVMIAPSTIYKTLSDMKEKALIKCTRKRNRRIYILTEHGQEIVKNMNVIIEEVHRFAKVLLGS